MAREASRCRSSPFIGWCLVCFGAQPGEKADRDAPEPEREDEPIRDQRCPLQEFSVGEVLDQDDKTWRCRNIPRSALNGRKVDRKRRQAPALALFRKVCHAGSVGMEQREAPSLAQAGIQPVEEEIKAPGFRLCSEGKSW